MGNYFGRPQRRRGDVDELSGGNAGHVDELAVGNADDVDEQAGGNAGDVDQLPLENAGDVDQLPLENAGDVDQVQVENAGDVDELRGENAKESSNLCSRDAGETCDASKESLLSELMNDYNFVKELESLLVGASVSNIKDLLFAFEISYEERCKILNPSTANLAFFDNLSKYKPHLTLRDLKNDVEQAMELGNTSIFSKIEEDISNRSVPITLESTLGKLSANPKDWQYILERVAGELIPEKGSMLPSWENIASVHGYSAAKIDYFKRHKQNDDKSPLPKVLSLLCAREHVPTVSSFVQKLREIKRADVAKMVEEWQLK